MGVTNTQTLTLSGTITNAGNFTKTGAGTLSLSGSNIYDGVTTISKGQISVSSSAALGSTVGNTVINETGSTTTGGRLSLSGNINTPENIFITGTGSPSGCAILNSGGVNTNSGLITLDGSASGLTYLLQVFSGTLNVNGGVTRSGANINSATIALNPNTALNINNNPYNNNGGQLTIGVFAGGGTVFLGVVGNNFAPVINFTNTLKLGVTDAVANNVTLIIGQYIGSNGGATGGLDMGTLDLNGYNQTFGGFFGAPNSSANPSTGSYRVVTNSSATSDSMLTVGNNNVSGDFDGVIKDGAHKVSLTKIGSSSLTLRGASTYSGATTIGAGSLVLTNNGSMANSIPVGNVTRLTH